MATDTQQDDRVLGDVQIILEAAWLRYAEDVLSDEFGELLAEVPVVHTRPAA